MCVGAFQSWPEDGQPRACSLVWRPLRGGSTLPAMGPVAWGWGWASLFPQ